MRFAPTVDVGAELAGGAVFGTVMRPDGHGRTQNALVPPLLAGRVARIANAGEVTVTEPLLQLVDTKGQTHEIALAHFWPVRTPRPVAARLPSDEPLVTGQRILDSLFPVALGGKGAIPAASAPARRSCSKRWPRAATPT
jgi:V/A-type H+/Na+-transporting ATPase subunit A